jgi:hypothetical protein
MSANPTKHLYALMLYDDYERRLFGTNVGVCIFDFHGAYGDYARCRVLHHIFVCLP